MNSFGRIFRISIFGESHGAGVGILIDGCPAGISLEPEDFLSDLSRRKSGKKGTTPRIEKDLPVIKSGIYKGKTSGAPILIEFVNENVRSKDYDWVKEFPRPGHADFTGRMKYKGYNDPRGGGHFSGRLTLGLVAAGVVARKIIAPIEISAKILEVGGDANIDQAIERAMNEGDSIGALIECQGLHMPIGLGEPFFDSLEAMIAHMVFSIPAIKGIEFGAGFQSAKMYGSEMNDVFIDENGKTATNHSGGINGGISNGNPLVFRVAVKPASSISKGQKSYNFKKHVMDELIIGGRHDACIGLRVPPVLESACAIAIADALLIHQ